MRSISWTAYGPPEVLQLQHDVPKPTPKDNELLIRVRAASVTAGDCEMRNLKLPPWIVLPMRLYIGFKRPRLNILGQEFSGDVEAIGNDVTHFNVGDAVFGSTGFEVGAYAEYICLPQDGVIAKKPANLSHGEAAAVSTGGLESWHFLGLAKIQPGEHVLINGAGGSIGTMGVQIAKHGGATVTAVDSGPKLAMLRDLGADHVLDYTQEDYTSHSETYDVIFDVVGKGAMLRAVRLLRPHGRFLMANPKIPNVLMGLWVNRTSDKHVVLQFNEQRVEDLRALAELIAEGVLRVIIDRRYSLEAVDEAHRYVETGQKAGNVIIDFAPE